MVKSKAVLMVFLVSFSGSVVAADFEKGLEAFRAGDFATALLELQPLAETGNANAQYTLGLMHEYGRGVKRNDAAAALWFQKAAEQNILDAQYRLGVLYENGWGVPQNADEAVHWYKLAAERGHPFAQHDLAFLHMEGKGVVRDGVQAYKWLRLASIRRSVMDKHLRTVAKTLSPDEIREGEKRASEWLQAQN